MNRKDLLKRVEQIVGRAGVAVVSKWAAHKRISQPGKPHKVLVILLAAMGDAITFLPALKQLKEAHPEWQIDLLTSSRAYPIFEGSPYLTEILNVDIYGSLSHSLQEFVKMIRNVRKRQYDIVIDTEQYSALTGLVTLISGAGQRIGFQTLGKQVDQAYTDVVEYAHDRHETACFVDLLKPLLGEQTYPTVLEPLSLSRSHHLFAERFLRSLGLTGELLIAIHPLSGATATTRRWPAQYFITLCRGLQAQFDASILLIGSRDEESTLQEMAKEIGGPVIVIAGRTTIREMAAIFTYCDLFIGNDSGPMHLAAAMQVPVVGLFGPNIPEKWGPLGPYSVALSAQLSCSPCIRVAHGEFATCREPICMTSLTPELVMEAAHGLLKRSVDRKIL